MDHHCAVKKEYKYSDITSRIINAAMKVHRTMGNGFQEVVYQRCLKVEMARHQLTFIREKEMPIYYEGILVGSRRVDFLVENKIMVEIKAVSQLNNSHLSQCLNYLEAYNLEIGLLLNFGANKLEFRRLINEQKCLQKS